MKGIKAWAEEDRPREKLLTKGNKALSDAELIAILIGSGVQNLSAVDVARDMLNRFGNDLNELSTATIQDLKKSPGIGEARAITIVAALELGRRRKNAALQSKPKINSSKDVYDIISGDLLDLQHEEFHILLLNRANVVMRKIRISIGGISGTVADPKLIFAQAIAHAASSIIVVHNHPSGNLKPSDADIKLTKKLVNAGEFLDLPVLDHLIFTNHGYFSFADEQMM